MILEGKLRNPDIKKYYVTGTISKKGENEALQKMLSKIQDGGINAFLNDKELGKFAKGLVSSFQGDGLLNEDKTLTAEGEEIVKSGKSLKTLQGALIVTVLSFNGKNFLLDAELAQKQNDNNEKNKNFNFDDTAEIRFPQKIYKTDNTEFCNIDFDKNFALQYETLKPEISFTYDFENQKCNVYIQIENSKKIEYKIETDESSDFQIIGNDYAWKQLKQIKETGCFSVDTTNSQAVTIIVTDEEQFENIKNYFEEFCKKGSFCFKCDDGEIDYTIKNINLIVDDGDSRTLNFLLDKFLMKKASELYLGDDEVGRLETNFLRLFESSPDITETAKNIYNRIAYKAEKMRNETPVPYLHLKAYIDLNPSETMKPYFEENSVKDLSKQNISMDDICQEIFGNDRNIKAIKMMSKFPAGNPWIARNVLLLAKCVHKNFGIKLMLITSDSQNKNPQYAEENKQWEEKIAKSAEIELVKKQYKEIKYIHDRYFKIERTNENIEWWKLPAELDQLTFENDRPRIRSDIQIDTKGKVKEMSWIKIKSNAVPEKLFKMMEEN